MDTAHFCHASGTTALEARALTKVYTMGREQVRALDAVDFVAAQGDFVVINGPSGSGKSTLLNLLALIDRPTSGQVLFLGTTTGGLSEGALAQLRRDQIGLVFQTFNLIPVLSTFENIEYPLLLTRLPRNERRTRVAALLEVVGLGDLARRRPDELSGGQRQRVAVARALVTQPRVVLADEPTANLDSATGGQIMGLLQDLNRNHCVTFLVVTHDPTVAEYAGRVLAIRDGRFEEEDEHVDPAAA